ncbi:MAG: hypothetical protein L0J45_01410 [Psychroflexus sp.]|nr:hypothetical protein [Psychroflexus sp.]MDN6309501.1 hypothetical protein [Psychroflexus sp.]
MKRLKGIIVLACLVLISCQENGKKDASATQKDVQKEKGTRTAEVDKHVKGDFIYIDSLAVLKGENFIYGITMNKKAEELVERTNAVKKDSFDMVPVTLIGEIKKSEDKNTWEEWLRIEEIVEVKAPQKQKVKLETK